ncbi:flagellar basal body rod protein FlgC [Aureliella helgolandensis]|uniref:Flagellar basal-body rod protein FlgC n=1 Tax=Aureliella helgolandensis TaxID=2527968 RepID=A0A518GEY2_9BACT|nr:flagellar basal body rod protein FlgC [Aureliella helgolandensis]QDV27110.1 Flagellar basal-body rod protein FlgC [Aureliella helgolandensis]
MIGALDVSTSALVAQRTRLNTISGNIANISTLQDENGDAKPYQPRYTIFQTDENMVATGNAPGVKVSSVEIDDKEPLYRYQPDHPLAVKEGKWKGYVAYPNINMNEQFVDALEATRSYEANIGVMEISKSLGSQSLSILA